MTQLFSFDNDPSNLDVWINDTEHKFVVNCHMRHGEGNDQKKTPPTAARFTFNPHSETVVPKMFRSAIHQYVCSEPGCRSAPGSKMCQKDCPSIVIVGGQCPQLKRKDRPDIPLVDALKPGMVEVKEMEMSGRPSFRLVPADAPQIEITAPGVAVSSAQKRRGTGTGT